MVAFYYVVLAKMKLHFLEFSPNMVPGQGWPQEKCVGDFKGKKPELKQQQGLCASPWQKEDVESVKNTMCEQNGNISEEIENLKRNNNKILELKITITEMNISLEKFRGTFEHPEESANFKQDNNMNVQYH